MADLEPVSTKRAYDARSRRRRAEHEREATRRAVLDAAKDLFLAHGYVATKMLDVAAEAGVAIASVYSVGASKADLLAMVLDAATGGEEPDTAPEDRPRFAAPGAPRGYPTIAAAPTPQQQVELMAALVSSIMARVAPLWAVLGEAARIDPKAAVLLEESLRRRRAAIAVAIASLPKDRLRWSAAYCADAVWALCSPELYHLLQGRGWTHERYRTWLTGILSRQLIMREIGRASCRERV